MIFDAEKELMNTDSDNLLRTDLTELGRLMDGMRAAYARGENAMEYARQTASGLGNSPIATLIAYDLQAGAYIAGAKANPDGRVRWCEQLAAVHYQAKYGSRSGMRRSDNASWRAEAFGKYAQTGAWF